MKNKSSELKAEQAATIALIVLTIASLWFAFSSAKYALEQHEQRECISWQGGANFAQWQIDQCNHYSITL